MTKIRRGGYVFIGWKGDHSPRHVHVFRNGRLVVKWDLDHSQAMQGFASRSLKSLIQTLEDEGLL